VTSASHREEDVEPESPGVPGFRTWRAIYLFVFGWFALVVVLLAVLTATFA